MANENSQNYPKELIRAMESLSSLIISEENVTSTVQKIAEYSVDAVEGAEEASVSLVTKNEISTVAATGEVGRKIDAIQYEMGEGPGLSSISDQTSFHIPDMEKDTTWPSFSKRAASDTGTKSMLSFVLRVHADSLGALNLTSDRIDAFDEEDTVLGSIFAVLAGVALANALTHARDQRQIDDLRTGMVTRQVIGQAVGLLMAQESLTKEEAFQKLARVSQNANVKLRDLAQRYVDVWEDKSSN